MKYKVVIIGAGVSGMTSAIYLKRAGISCCIIEKNIPGGQINYTSTIENYPGNPNILGPDLAYNIYNQVQSLEIPFLFEEVQDIKIMDNCKKVITNNQEIETDYVLIATGRNPRKLNVLNEKELSGKGVSYCAICDGPLYKNQDVAVIGGGDSAIKESLYLSNICKKVTIIHRRDKLKETKEAVNLKQKNNIEIKYNSEVQEFIGKEKLEGIILKDGSKIDCNACFIFIGYTPSSKIFSKIKITDKNGYIKTNATCETKIKGIYAIGDVRKKDIFQIISAMNDGVIASSSIINIEKNSI